MRDSTRSRIKYLKHKRTQVPQKPATTGAAPDGGERAHGPAGTMKHGNHEKHNPEPATAHVADTYERPSRWNCSKRCSSPGRAAVLRFWRTSCCLCAVQSHASARHPGPRLSSHVKKETRSAAHPQTRVQAQSCVRARVTALGLHDLCAVRLR